MLETTGTSCSLPGGPCYGPCLLGFSPRASYVTQVALSIYDLHGASAINAVTKQAGFGGAFHIGLEIYDLEWSYGWTKHGTGVHVVRPGKSWQGTFRERISLGRTNCTPRQVIGILTVLRRSWPGRAYHPLKKNCGHFCEVLAQHLHVSDVPKWINAMAAMGDKIADGLHAKNGQASFFRPSIGGSLGRPSSVSSLALSSSCTRAPSCTAQPTQPTQPRKKVAAAVVAPALARNQRGHAPQRSAARPATRCTAASGTADNEDEDIDSCLGISSTATPTPVLSEPVLHRKPLDQDDPEMEKDWRWATREMLVHSAAANPSGPCVIA